MKTTTISSPRVDADNASHDDVTRRLRREDFISRGLASRNDARRTGKYFDASDVHADLENMLKGALAGRLHLRI